MNAALISARCVNACGKLPSCSPVGPISSEYNPRWLAYVSIFSNARRASSSRPARVSASTYQNEQIENEPAEYDYIPGYYAVFFHDPDGIKLEIVHVPEDPRLAAEVRRLAERVDELLERG